MRDHRPDVKSHPAETEGPLLEYSLLLTVIALVVLGAVSGLSGVAVPLHGGLLLLAL